MSKEDEIFMSALEAQGLKRTKDMYEKASLPHICSMCLEDNGTTLGYRLKIDLVEDYNSPYLYICNECYKELLG